MAKVDKTKKNEPEVKKPVVYYCTKGQYTFTIPEYERDEFGAVVKKDGVPKVLYVTDDNGNNRHSVHIHIQFERVPVKDPKTGKTNAMHFLGRLIVQPENERYDDIIAYLEKAKKNAYNGLKTEDEYKEMHNPDAYAFEKRMSMYETENTELKEYNEKLRKKLEEAGIKLNPDE